MMIRKKNWSEFNPIQQTMVVILGTVQFGLLVAALWDIRQRTADELNGSRTLWTIASFINFVGPIAYFSFGRRR